MSNTVSTKYQIVIPKAVRRKLDIQPGQKMQVKTTNDGCILIKKINELYIHSDLTKYAGVIKTNETEWGKQHLNSADWIRQQRDNEW